MTVKLTGFNIQDYLKTPKDQAEYSEPALEDGTVDEAISAIGDIARARSVTEFACAGGVSRETLSGQCRPGGNPRFDAIAKAMAAPGLQARLAAAAKAL